MSKEKEIQPYQQIKFVAGDFEGLLGKTLGPVSADDDGCNWYVEVHIGLNKVVREVALEDIAPL